MTIHLPSVAAVFIAFCAGNLTCGLVLCLMFHLVGERYDYTEPVEDPLPDSDEHRRAAARASIVADAEAWGAEQTSGRAA